MQILCHFIWGLEHLWTLLTVGDPGINSTRILRDDYVCNNIPKIV
jgi:hypothetical protein